MRITLWTILILALGVPRLEASPLVLVVDPGHGGTNLGARSGQGVMEKEITLYVARMLARSLAQVSGIRVVLTRTGDDYLTLSERVRIANRSRADLFLSLHCNASPRQDQRGYEVFVTNPVSLRRQERPTARAPLSKTVTDPTKVQEMEVAAAVAALRRSGVRRQSTELARSLLTALSAVFGAESNRGLRQGHFDVLMGLEMPGVLVELGFLDHPVESRILIDRVRLRLVASALAGAIRRHGTERYGLAPEPSSRGRTGQDPGPEPTRPIDRRRPSPGVLPRSAPVRPAVAFERAA